MKKCFSAQTRVPSANRRPTNRRSRLLSLDVEHLRGSPALLLFETVHLVEVVLCEAAALQVLPERRLVGARLGARTLGRQVPVRENVESPLLFLLESQVRYFVARVLFVALIGLESTVLRWRLATARAPVDLRGALSRRRSAPRSACGGSLRVFPPRARTYWPAQRHQEPRLAAQTKQARSPVLPATWSLAAFSLCRGSSGRPRAAPRSPSPSPGRRSSRPPG